MTIHQKNLTAAVRAMLATGHHISTKEGGDPFGILAKKFGDHADETLKQFASFKGEVSERLDVIEQKANRGNLWGDHDAKPESWGEQFTRHEEQSLKSMSRDRHVRAHFELKAVSTDPASAGAMIVTQRDGTNLLPRQRLTIRSLLQVVSISTGTVEYVQQTGRPTGTGMVAEGALKPESSMSFDLKSTTARVIAHWIKASKQVLDDLPQLRDLIDSEMRYGLALEEEAQILNGDGTGQNLSGLIPNATAYADPLGYAEPTMLDTIEAAILQGALADFEATGIVLHPADWTRMRLTKDADGRYILGEPSSTVEPRLFGLPVVPTKAMAANHFLVGNFAAAATLYDRWEPSVDVGYVNDDFTRNLVTVLAEERVAMAVKNPAALIYGAFAAG